MNKELKDINYIDIFKKSLDITWKNKTLWWFGLFLAIGGGGINNFNYVFDEKNTNSNKIATQFISNHPGLVIAGAIILGVIFLVLMILSIFARSGAIESIEKILKNTPFGFRSEMKEGKKYFWKLFFLYITLFFLITAAVIVLAIPVIFLFTVKAYLLGIMLSVIAILIFIPLIVLASYIKTYGELYVVSGKLSSGNAISASYELFGKNLAASLIMGLLFIPIGIILMMGMIIAIAPLAVLAFVFAYLGKIGIAVTVILGIIIFLIILIIQSVFQVFHQTAWLLFFHEIATPEIEEKIEETVSETEEEIIPAAGDVVKTIEREG
jgi:hypothetical protein